MSGPRRFTSLTFDSLAKNLALDELLLVSAEEESSDEIFRVWEQPNYAVVLGAGCRLSEEVDVQRCLDDEIPVLRRSSGGGTVLLGPGCLCYSLVLALETDAALRGIRSSYASILARTAAALDSLHTGVHQAGISDLAIGDRKFSGSAQQRKRSYLLHHGTLLYYFDLARVGQYLRLPARRPEYRASRSHDEFLMNISASAELLTTKLQQAWQATASAIPIDLERVRSLAGDKYLADDWTYRR